jgi:hypothetical protein
MASSGPFAFTGGATAMWHWRSASRDNSMRSVPGPVWLETAQRIRDRFRNLPFVGSLQLAQLAELGATATTTEVSAASLPPIELDTTLLGGLVIARQVLLSGFHGPEEVGIWTKEKVAWIDLNPSIDARRGGGIVVLRFMPSCGPQQVKWFEAEMEGSPRIRSTYSTWDDQEVRFPIPPDPVGMLRITLRIAELLKGGVISEDMRDIGLYLRYVAILPAVS